MERIDWSAVALVAGVVVAFSFALAAMGHGGSLWLWRDMLGVL